MTTTGQQLGSFILGEPIGRSGLALVHRAHHAATGQPALLKIMHRYFATESDVLAAFFNELATVRALRHPNIVAVEDFGMEGATVWVASEWVDGVSLRDASPPPHAPALVAAIITQIAEALEAAHAQRLLHRNLKPSNVLIMADGAAKLSDFGMATLASGVHPLMRTGLSTPMPAFMSPEQLAGDALTPSSDVHALGVLAYWLLTGELPFPGDAPETVLARQLGAAPVAPSHHQPNLSREINATVLKALSPFIPARFAAPRDFAQALHEATVTADSLPPDFDDLRVEASVPAVDGNIAASTGTATDFAEPSSVELAFRRIWMPTKADPRAMVRPLTIAALVTAAVVTWWWWSNFRPAPALPPPTTTLSVEADSGTWPAFARDSARTSADTGIDPQFSGQVRWTFATREPLFASPVAVDDLVYLPTGERRIVALEATTGAVRWEFPTTGPVDSTPAIAGDMLFVGLRDGRLLCLDRHTGALRWQFEAGFPILSSPMVAAGTVFFGGGDSAIHAVDAATGQERWSFPTAGWVVSSPAVVDDLVIVGSRDGWVYFLKMDNGERVFYFRTSGAIEASPAVADGRVFVGNEQRRFWALRTSERSTPLDRQLYAVHAQLFLWGFTAPPPPPKGAIWAHRAAGRFVGGAAVGPAGVFTGNEDGRVYAWTREGANLWQFKAKGPILSTPALVGSTLYVGSDDGNLYALDAASGQQRWTFPAGGRIRSEVAVTRDGLYVASENGVLYALR